MQLDMNDLRIQWRTFNGVLLDLGEKMEEKAQKEANDITSLENIRVLIDPKENHYKGIEGILSILVRASVAMGGVESVCESMVSVMEAHTPAGRVLLDQERLEDEIIVAWNGDDIYHCDKVVKAGVFMFHYKVSN